jgi:hypothetical protein
MLFSSRRLEAAAVRVGILNSDFFILNSDDSLS